METKKYFISLMLWVFALFTYKIGTAQQPDSLQYGNGYLYYHQYGATNLPAVVLLTGGPGNAYIQLEAMAKTLSAKFRCILPEQRGTGKSIPSPFDATTINVNLITRDIQALMDKLGLSSAIIIGHSWGGALAMSFAAQFPQRVQHLVLIAPGPHKDVKKGFDVLYANRTHTRSFEEEQRLTKLNDKISQQDADSADVLEASKLFRRAYIFANPIPDSIFALVNTERNAKTSDILLKELFENFDLSKVLNNYKGKVDVIAGRQDIVGFFSYELKQDRPSANLFWINQCGHFPMYEQPTEFYRILYAVLNVR